MDNIFDVSLAKKDAHALVHVQWAHFFLFKEKFCEEIFFVSGGESCVALKARASPGFGQRNRNHSGTHSRGCSSVCDQKNYKNENVSLVINADAPVHVQLYTLTVGNFCFYLSGEHRNSDKRL